MATFIVELARLVCETKRVEVEAEDADKIDLASVYEQDDGTGFEPDDEWGCEEGTHVLIGEKDSPAVKHGAVREAIALRGEQEEVSDEPLPLDDEDLALIAKH